jgi:membrane-associated phospholipid phosphatase
MHAGEDRFGEKAGIGNSAPRRRSVRAGSGRRRPWVGASGLWLAGIGIGFPVAAGAAVSPYSLHLQLDFPLALGGAALRGVAEGVDRLRYRDSTDYAQLTRAELGPYDRWAIGYYSRPADLWSTALTAAELAVPVALDGWDMAAGKEARLGVITDLIIYSEVYFYSSSLAVFAKSLHWHPRPLAFTSRAPAAARKSSDAGSSFFSAHTTSAFASAVFTGYTFQLKHPDSPFVPWLWGGMLGAASTVGALRIYSGKHFPSDVAVGAAVGSLAGYGIPRLHLNPVAKDINKESSRKEETSRSTHRMDVHLALLPLAFPEPGMAALLIASFRN